MYSGQKYLSQPLIIKPPATATRPNGPSGPRGSFRGCSCSRKNKTRNLTIKDCQVGCPIRRSRDQSLLPAPPGLSQVITSFIASDCLGIHQTPFSRLIRSRRLMKKVLVVCRKRQTCAGLFPFDLAVSGSPAGAMEWRLGRPAPKSISHLLAQKSFDHAPPGSRKRRNAC